MGEERVGIRSAIRDPRVTDFPGRMLIRNLTLGLAAALVAACAQMPQEQPDALATAEPAVTPIPLWKEQPPVLPVETPAQSPPPALAAASICFFLKIMGI